MQQELIENVSVKKYEYFLMFFLLSISGNPFVFQNQAIFLMVAVVIPIYVYLVYRPTIISKRILFIFLFFLGFEVLHAVVYRLDYSFTIVKLFLMLLVGFSILYLLKGRFVIVLVKTMYYISLISFVFTVLCYVPGVNTFLYSLAGKLFPLTSQEWKGYVTPTLLIYTFFPQFFDGSWTYVRNSGIFWESGAFAVFLNITLYLYYASKNITQVKDMFDKYAIVLIIAVLTTTSTMGFLTITVIMTFFSFRAQSLAKYAFLLSVGVAIVFSTMKVEYLGRKISSQLSESATTQNRFGSALLDFNDFAKKPFIGWSRRQEVLFGDEAWESKGHRPNGLTNLLRNYGIVYFSAYFILVFYSFRTVAQGRGTAAIGVLGIVVLWFVGFSEPIFDTVFLKSLLFLSMVYNTEAIAGQRERVKRLTLFNKSELPQE